jgi:hypothetical protein
MLKLLLDPNFIYRFFAVSFILIQPSKILAALTGAKFVLGQFLAPFALHLVSLVARRDTPQLRLHGIVLSAQLVITGIHLGIAELYPNVYMLLFFVTPHFCLFLADMFRQKPDGRFLIRTLSGYIMLSFALSMLSIYVSRMEITPGTILSTLDLNFLTRSETGDRHRILSAINYGMWLFDLPKTTLEGVALTVYPLVLISLCFLRPKYVKDPLVLPGLACALLYLSFKSSRGEFLFLLVLLGYPLAELLFTRRRWPALLILGFGYLQLFLGNQTLNGRRVLNELFLDNLSLFGNGVGFSAQEILRLTRKDYSSFHNIHFELITNFGIWVYVGFLAFTAYYILTGKYNRNRHYYLCLLFVLFATNFELFDLYFAVPLGLVALEVVSSYRLKPKALPAETPELEQTTDVVY